MAFQCMECGYRFRSVAAAERAAFGDDGCPGCGGSDVDEADSALPSFQVRPGGLAVDPDDEPLRRVAAQRRWGADIGGAP